MFRSFLSKWIEERRRKGRVGTVCRAQRPTVRPRLEALEERTLMNAGMLDATFGVGGVVFPNSPLSSVSRYVFAAQADGGLVEAGNKNNLGFEVLRQNPDGSPDAAFGTGGAVFVSTGGLETVEIDAIAIQADGKILVGGGSFSDLSSFVARLNSNGTLDQTFGNGGFVDNVLGSGSVISASGLAIQADGKIVLSGAADGQFALARYDANGNLDASFGNGGTVVTAVGSGDLATSMALQADGRIIVAGSYSNVPGQNAMALVRYNTNGSLDSTFGNSGVVETVLGDDSAVTDLAVQADGDIVAAGYSLAAPIIGPYYGSEAVLVRYTSVGTVDATFGDNGYVFTGIDPFNYGGSGAGPELALQADGKIVLGTDIEAGAVDGTPLDRVQVVLARYDATGAVDSTFGADGQVATTLGQDAAYLSDLTIQPDGRIVTEGVSYDYGQDFGSVNYTPHLTLAGFESVSAPVTPTPTPTPVPTPTDGPSDPSGTPVTSTPSVVMAPSTPPPVLANTIVFTQGAPFQGQSVVVPQSLVVPIAPPPVGESTVNSHSATDPFGIHLVGGSEPGIDDATTKWDDFPVLTPDSLMGDAATGLAVLPFAPADEAGVFMTVVMDAIFQQLPLRTRAESALVGAVEPSAVPLAHFTVKGNPTAPPHLKSEAGRWPSLAAGVLLTTGMTAAAVDVHRRRTRLPYSTTME